MIEGEVFDWKLKREKEAREGKNKSRLTAEEEARRQQEVLVRPLLSLSLSLVYPMLLTISSMKFLSKF